MQSFSGTPSTKFPTLLHGQGPQSSICTLLWQVSKAFASVDWYLQGAMEVSPCGLQVTVGFAYDSANPPSLPIHPLYADPARPVQPPAEVIEGSEWFEVEAIIVL
jgi:hypothetical protein